MDHKALKLELIERIALIDDDVLLQAVKRLLDAPRGYAPPNEHLSVVREGEGAYLIEIRGRLHGLVDGIQDPGELERLHGLLSTMTQVGPGGVWSNLTDEQRDKVMKGFGNSLDDRNLRPSDEVLKRNRP